MPVLVVDLAATASLIAVAVAGPTTPSSARLFARWNAPTAAAVVGPKLPSAAPGV